MKESAAFFEFAICDGRDITARALIDVGRHCGPTLFVNPHTMVCALTDPRLRDSLSKARNFCDGIGLAFALRVFGYRIKRLTGPECLRQLLEAQEEIGYRVVVICPSPKVAQQLENWWKVRDFNTDNLLTVVVGDMTNSNDRRDEELVMKIRAFEADLLFTAFGSPKQESWLGRVSHRMPGVAHFGFGAAVEFMVGAKSRAPSVFRALGLEWLIRLLFEPRRLWRRNVNSLLFVNRVIQKRLSGEDRWCD
jgi:N-acetylglucosaminyldiphosphoundecaprenol N-acetyl-beta-D-mannosaminyltransferase